MAFTHKLLTDVRDDDLLEVAIDVSGSLLGDFVPSGYVLFNEKGDIIVPFSGDRRVLVSENGVSVLDGADDVLAFFPHDE